MVSEMATEFEEAVRLSGGWVDLALPSAEDAARYFASFRRAPPDNSALVPGPQVLHGSFELGSILSTLSVLVDVQGVHIRRPRCQLLLRIV